MNLSDDRVNHLSHLILNTLKSKGGAGVADESKLLAGIKSAFRDFGNLLENADHHIRQKIGSLKRQVQEGSREWDILYRQYLDEELAKKGL